MPCWIEIRGAVRVANQRRLDDHIRSLPPTPVFAMSPLMG
jgi:hypothetical protein